MHLFDFVYFVFLPPANVEIDENTPRMQQRWFESVDLQMENQKKKVASLVSQRWKVFLAETQPGGWPGASGMREARQRKVLDSH